MGFDNLTMDLTALNSVTPPNISISSENILDNIIGVANLSTGDYLIFGSLIIIFVIVYLTLTDRTPFGDFGFDDLRGVNISFATCVLMGLTIVEIGWSGNFFAVGMFGTAWLVSYIMILFYENQE